MHLEDVARKLGQFGDPFTEMTVGDANLLIVVFQGLLDTFPAEDGFKGGEMDMFEFTIKHMFIIVAVFCFGRIGTFSWYHGCGGAHILSEGIKCEVKKKTGRDWSGSGVGSGTS